MKRYNTSVLLILLVGLLGGCSTGQAPDQPAPDQHSEDAHAPASPQAASATVVAGYGAVELDPQRMGVVTERIGYRDFTYTIRTVGVVALDETRVAHIQAKFSGWIEELYVDYIGKPVHSGQPLFSIYSPELVATQQEYLLALKSLDIKASGGGLAAASQDWARRLVAASRSRLELWDIPPEEVARLETDGVPHRTLTINSPREGVVLSKTAIKGMNVEPGMDLFAIADLSTVWLQADIYERDLPHVRLQQRCVLTMEALPGQTLYGIVEFISPVVEESTRTAKIRLQLDNRAGLLKPGMYGTVQVAHEMAKSLALPETALIDTGTRKIVFVATGDRRFEPREVQVRSELDGFYQILSGLSEGDAVAVSAQFLLDSESKLRATGGRVSGHAGGHAPAADDKRKDEK
jgi:membrane fusion protein, copper/silver efflux system